MMSKPQVTILVAVWNTAAYLPQCLESLRRQTLRDIQVVCVDDESTDESLAVLRHYADLDERIEVVALPKNQGQAHARNCCSARFAATTSAKRWQNTAPSL